MYSISSDFCSAGFGPDASGPRCSPSSALLHHLHRLWHIHAGTAHCHRSAAQLQVGDIDKILIQYFLAHIRLSLGLDRFSLGYNASRSPFSNYPTYMYRYFQVQLRSLTIAHYEYTRIPMRRTHTGGRKVFLVSEVFF